MSRRVIIGVAAAFVLAACSSGGDDDAASSETGEQTAAETSEETADATEEPTGETTGDETSGDDGTDATADEVTSDDGGDPPDESTADDGDDAGDDDAGDDDAGDDGDDGETVQIDSLSDVPPECMDLFVGFLRDLEPLVEDIDWETATMAEMGELDEEFQTISDDFDAESSRLGCDQFEFDSNDDDGFEQMIEIAEREAPGTVGFFEFLAGLSDLVPDPTDDGESAAGAPATCDEAVEQIESLVAEYGQVQNVPAGELAQVAQLSTSLSTLCSIVELDAVLQREDIAAFFDG